MSRVTVWFKDSDKYVSVIADNFYEYEGVLKIYNGTQPAAIFEMSTVSGVYMTEERK
jgi:hypothetical protein